jgi:acetyl-CoA C-acetyltransferase
MTITTNEPLRSPSGFAVSETSGRPWTNPVAGSNAYRHANATKLALEKAGLSIDDVDLFEINEAFASVALNSMRMLDVPEDKVNVNGGAIALGHPIGASGARILMTLVNELRRRGGGLGVAAICSGGGQGDAVIVEVNGS